MATANTQAPSQMGLLGRFLLKCRDREKAVDDCFVNEFFDQFSSDGRVGGMGGIVDFAAETHESAKESKSVATRTGWIKTLLELAKENERVRSEQINQFTDEELHARMVVAVIQEIQSNPQFATVMMVEAVRSLKDNPNLPDLIDNMIRLLEGMKFGDFTAANTEVDRLLYEPD